MSDGVKYWILPDVENRIKEGSITAHFSTEVAEIGTDMITAKSREGKTLLIPNDFVFVLIGYHPDVDFLKSIGVQTDPESMAPLHDPATMETNVPGLYIAGSIAAGRNNNKIFIENGRMHGKAIMPSILARR